MQLSTGVISHNSLLLIWLLTISQLGRADISCDYSAGSYNITSQEDADALSSCPLVWGDVVVIPNRGSTDEYVDIVLNGIMNITGQLLIPEYGFLGNFTAPDLVAVGDSLSISNGVVTNITFNSLSTVGNLYVENYLKILEFPTGLNSWSQAPGTISITYTGLSSLEGINFDSANTVNISHNPGLLDFSLPLKNASSITLLENGEIGTFGNATFPELSGLNSSSFHGVDCINLPSLVSAQDFEIYNMSGASLSLPSFVGSEDTTFVLRGSRVTSLSLPSLQDLSYLSLEDNSWELYSNISTPHVQRIFQVDISEPCTYDINCTYWVEHSTSLVCVGPCDTGHPPRANNDIAIEVSVPILAILFVTAVVAGIREHRRRHKARRQVGATVELETVPSAPQDVSGYGQVVDHSMELPWYGDEAPPAYNFEAHMHQRQNEEGPETLESANEHIQPPQPKP